MSAKEGTFSINDQPFLIYDATAAETFTREDLTPAQKLLGQTAAEFMRTEVLPREQEIYAKDWDLTRKLLLKAGDLDLLRIDIPEVYGGLNLDKVSSAYLAEQIGIMPSFAGSLGAHTTIGTLPLVYFGTEVQKERYLSRLASGEWVAAFALTEPGSGSDALAAKTQATLDADRTHYILNGQKMWITNGGFADLFTIFAQVDGQKFTAFLVERSMGVVSGREEPKLGLDGSSTTALNLENVRVPVDNVLGNVGQGHKVAFNVLNLGRLKLGTRNLAAAKQALTRAARYSVERQQFGRAIAEFGLIKQKLGEMAVRCYVGDAMVYRTLGAVDEALEQVEETDTTGILKTIESFAVECSVNKVWTSEALAFVVDEALQVYGGYGYSKEFPGERAYRDARITRIYEGTNEINRLIIPTRLLKNPATAELFTAERVRAALSDLPAPNSSLGVPELVAARQLLTSGKRLVIFTLGTARAVYGKGLPEEQEVLAHIADIVIDTYALESAILRTEKLLSTRREGDCQTTIDITNVFATDAADRLASHGRQVAAAMLSDAAADSGALPPIPHLPFNAVAARRRIAASIINAGRYHL
jgi:alkylation response protein AidB-like acyl-CoA dehydrogenase